MLTCNECAQTLPTDRFYANKTAYPRRGYDVKCKTCRRRYVKQWRDALPPGYRAEHEPHIKGSRNAESRAKHLRKKYGLTVAEYDALLLAQGGVCAICESPPPATGRMRYLAVDHDHETGIVRGLLCNGCNGGLGLLGDGDLLAAAAEYLQRTRHVSLEDGGYPGACNL